MSTSVRFYCKRIFTSSTPVQYLSRRRRWRKCKLPKSINMNSLKSSQFAILCFFLVTIVGISAGEENGSSLIQTFRLHGDERCEDHGESYSENIRNLAKVSHLVKTKTLRCACADFGVWSYSPRVNYYGGPFGGSHLAVTKIESDKTCVTLGKNSSILSIRKVGNPDVTVPAMSFYVDFSLRGREMYFDGTFVELPWPILFRSVGFTGLNASWALYPTTDGTGTFTCMGQKENTLITYSSGTKINLIGSVRRAGCLYPSGEPLGPIDPTEEPTPSIALNLRDRSKELATDSEELRLPFPVTVYSYSFRGDSNWTLYRGILFNGRSKCLLSTGTESGPQNFMDEAGEYPVGSVVVGSIRRGCHHVRPTQYEDYPTQNDDIYDYEDGYGKVASTSTSSNHPSSSSVLISIALLMILPVLS